jgi:glycosyltransferase involved in cell wall biosynthesis
MRDGRLRLAMLAPNVVRADGQGRAMLELARAAADEGHEVTVYSRGIDEELAAHPRVNHRRMPGRGGPALLLDGLFAAAASRAMRERRHDLACVMGACAFPAIPYVYYAEFSWHAWRCAWPAEHRPSMYHRAHASTAARLETRCLRRAVAAIAAGRRVAADLGAVLGDRGNATSVTVVPNGVDTGEFAPASPQQRADARRRFGLADDHFVVALVGEYKTPRKGLGPLIEAVAMSNDPSERLLVAGDGPRPGVDHTHGRVQYAGRVVPVAPVFHAADVVAVPSLYEPFSLVALEAAAAGLPLVLTECVGAAEWLADAAVVVPAPPTPGALRAAIDVLRADDVGRRRRAANARAVADDLHWNRTSRQALEVLERAATLMKTEVRS